MLNQHESHQRQDHSMGIFWRNKTGYNEQLSNKSYNSIVFILLKNSLLFGKTNILFLLFLKLGLSVQKVQFICERGSPEL